MTHDELIKCAEYWLLNTKKCDFVFTEFNTSNSETPDAIGFRKKHTILVECKISRSDFLADKNKSFRKNPKLGMGAYRFYMCPKGVIKKEDLPTRWGLIYVNEGKCRQVVGPKGNKWGATGKNFYFKNRNTSAENTLLLSALRRLHLRGVLPLIYEPPETRTRKRKRK